MRTRSAKFRILAVLIAAFAIIASACSSNETGAESAASGGSTAVPGKDATKVGFIFVGPKDDYGYNQAAYEASQAVGDATGVEVLTQENVPEDDNAVGVMEKMIADGATIIFATSYGHLDAAMKVAADHPDVVVVQQGNFIKDTILPNTGTYFGTVYEPVYLAGIAVGKATTSNKLGFVYAIPIPQTIANINAFQLGAKSVNPDAETIALPVQSAKWCDPAGQTEAFNALLSQGVDVVTQHQDCTATITKAAESAGIKVVGYHADASELAPKGWLTGSEWDWDALYIDIVKTAQAGNFTGSKYNANYRVGYKPVAGDTNKNPFVQSKYGPSVDQATQDLIAAAKEEISTTGSPFAGPVIAQDGTVLIAEGVVPDYDTIEKTMTVFVEGVQGNLASS